MPPADEVPPDDGSFFGELFLNQSYRVSEHSWGEGDNAMSLKLQVK